MKVTPTAIDGVLEQGTRQLQASGFSARTAFVTSSTFGGVSWLAHSTLQSGVWANSQLRYNQLVGTDRFTLSDAFKRAGWRTVVDSPADDHVWSAGKTFYHYDAIYDRGNVGYHGPSYTYASMPDQYLYLGLQRLELDGVHVLVQERVEAARQLDHAVGRREVHDRNATGRAQDLRLGDVGVIFVRDD